MYTIRGSDMPRGHEDSMGTVSTFMVCSGARATICDRPREKGVL